MTDKPDEELWVVQNGYIGNSLLFWALKDQGYTCDVTKIQTYTKEEAMARCRPDCEERAWPYSMVMAATTTVVDDNQKLDFSKSWQPELPPEPKKPRHSERCTECGQFMRENREHEYLCWRCN